MRQRYEHYSDNEKKRLIMECRQSGMSDYQWCRENGINCSTFYYWIKKFRNTACEDALTSPALQNQVIQNKQDIVKVNIFPKDETITAIPSKTSGITESFSMELSLNGFNIKIYNNADLDLLTHTLNLLRGNVC